MTASNSAVRVDGNTPFEGQGSLLIAPSQGVLVVRTEGESAQRIHLCGGEVLFLPEDHSRVVFPEGRTGGRGWVWSLSAPGLEPVLQGLPHFDTRFSAFDLATARQWAAVSLESTWIVPGMERALTIAYARHGSALQRLPGRFEHRVSIYRRLLSARHQLYRNLASNIHALADQHHLSYGHLLQMFRAAFGQTPKRDQVNARLLRALNFLAFGPDQVNDIAENCGYSNRTAFTRVFSAQVGCAPIAFRERVQGAPAQRAAVFFETVYEVIRRRM